MFDVEIEKSVTKENPNFTCKKCNSNNLWYTSGETSDGAYNIYYYHCHSCSYRWNAIADYD